MFPKPAKIIKIDGTSPEIPETSSIICPSSPIWQHTIGLLVNQDTNTSMKCKIKWFNLIYVTLSDRTLKQHTRTVYVYACDYPNCKKLFENCKRSWPFNFRMHNFVFVPSAVSIVFCNMDYSTTLILYTYFMVIIQRNLIRRIPTKAIQLCLNIMIILRISIRRPQSILKTTKMIALWFTNWSWFPKIPKKRDPTHPTPTPPGEEKIQRISPLPLFQGGKENKNL